MNSKPKVAPNHTAPSIESMITSPVRIYVLWHPGFDRTDLQNRREPLSAQEKNLAGAGLRIARRIYHWLRLDTMEGIPVYFRSLDNPDSDPLAAIPPVNGINYIIPLVDANMVASPEWRAYVGSFFSNGQPTSGNRIFPVAMDSVAYNMPETMRKMNFIRHEIADGSDEVLISRLTEVLCRDLRNFVCTRAARDGAMRPPDKLKIFLSHAKADDTKEAMALKKYLQEETQCEAFFDETDIASGYDYANILGHAIEDESAGLIVIQGDHYADRPWCRREIRDFLKPVGDPPGENSRTSALFIPPVVVVQTMQGKRIARNIADLGHAPCVRWHDGAERFIVTTLLREILFGLFYRLLARGLKQAAPSEETVFINRTPDPVMVARLMVACGDFAPKIVAHPGYGLSSLERDALKDDFPALDFLPFSQIPPEQGIDELPDLKGQTLCVSVGNAPDILASGQGDEHIQELLQRILRPLFRKQASLIYGGRLPDTSRPSDPWGGSVNYTGAFLDLLLSERASGWKGTPAVSRLYNLSPWPYCEKITPYVIAQWTDICSFIPVTPAIAGCALPIPPVAPDPEELADLDAAARHARRNEYSAEAGRYGVARDLAEARCLTAMREMACEPMFCPLPDGPRPPDPIVTFAHLFIGGKIATAKGIAPGIFEEILYALEAGKPVFPIGASRGAAGLVAGWILHPPPTRPKELRLHHYITNDKLRAVNEALEGHPGDVLDRLWNLIDDKACCLKTLLHNGLEDQDNRLLLAPDTGVSTICQLIWKGISKLGEIDSRPTATP